MLKKFFAVATLMLAGAAVSFAGTYARLDLNCKSGAVFKVLSPNLPKGMSVNGKKKNTIFVNLEKVREFSVKLEVLDIGGATDIATVTPSLTPVRYPKDGKTAVIECTEFEVADKSSAAVPCKITKWKRMIDGGVTVSRGDKITVRAKIREAAAE